MSDDRKKPVWPWIVALLIGLPVLYVASFGPACWSMQVKTSWMPTIAVVYSPVIRIAATAPPWAQRFADWYSGGRLKMLTKELRFMDRSRKAQER